MTIDDAHVWRDGKTGRMYLFAIDKSSAAKSELYYLALIDGKPRWRVARHDAAMHAALILNQIPKD